MTTKTFESFLNDPIAYFDGSITEMHMIPRAELDALQRRALATRFAQHRESIEMIHNLADRLGITEMRDLDDVVPLLLPHTAYKSYPSVLLDRKRFDLMTGWLQKLTPVDLSGIDCTGCDSIEEWIDRLDEGSELRVITSSGTTGTISIIPKDKEGGFYQMRTWRLFLFQRFGEKPPEVYPDVDVVWPNYAEGKLGHLRMVGLLKNEFTGNDESRFHPLYQQAVSTDLMFLASKLRAAASRGELDRVEIDPKLLERKAEFEALEARRPQEMEAFFSRITSELAGKQIFMTGTYAMLYELARSGLERGVKNVFARDSAILTGGGMKGHTLPGDYMEVIKDFLGVDRIQEGYGMSETSTFHWACEEGRYHVQPWCIPYVLDPETSRPLPREGIQTGRAAFFDLPLRSHWGGSITGDEITVDFGTRCACGLESAHIAHEIMRYTEKEGIEDDRITCNATQEVHDEAVNFLKELEA